MVNVFFAQGKSFEEACRKLTDDINAWTSSKDKQLVGPVNIKVVKHRAINLGDNFIEVYSAIVTKSI